MKRVRRIEFSKAIEAIEVISSKSEDKRMYDQREKAQRDYEWALAGAREDGMEKGMEKGIEEGIQKGQWIGKLNLLKEFLGEPEMASSELVKLRHTEIQRQIAVLQERLRLRDL